MRWIVFLTLCIPFMSCDQINQALDHSSSDERLANKITKQVAKKLKEEHDLYPAGSGGRMMNEIKMLALSFNYYKPIDMDQARELLIIAVTEFVDAVNANEKIRPYLYNYPFEPKNIEIAIFLQNPDGSEPDYGKLSVVGAVDGILDYDVRDPKTGRLTTIYKETFEEALEKSKRAGLSHQKAS